jgi:hypothetical protein
MCAVDLSGRIFHRLLQDMADDLERHRPQRVQNILTAILKGDENAQPGMQAYHVAGQRHTAACENWITGF